MALNDLLFGRRGPVGFNPNSPLRLPTETPVPMPEMDPYQQYGQQNQAAMQALMEAMGKPAPTARNLPRPGALGIATLVDLLLGGGDGSVLGNFVGGFQQGDQSRLSQEMGKYQQEQALAKMRYEGATQQAGIGLEGAKYKQGRKDAELDREDSLRRERAVAIKSLTTLTNEGDLDATILALKEQGIEFPEAQVEGIRKGIRRKDEQANRQKLIEKSYATIQNPLAQPDARAAAAKFLLDNNDGSFDSAELAKVYGQARELSIQQKKQQAEMERTMVETKAKLAKLPYELEEFRKKWDKWATDAENARANTNLRGKELEVKKGQLAVSQANVGLRGQELKVKQQNAETSRMNANSQRLAALAGKESPLVRDIQKLEQTRAAAAAYVNNLRSTQTSDSAELQKAEADWLKVDAEIKKAKSLLGKAQKEQDRQQGLQLLKSRPDLREQIKRRFRETYNEEIG